MNYFIIIIF